MRKRRYSNLKFSGIFLIISFVTIGFPWVIVAQNTGNDLRNIELLTNPELHNEADIRNFTRQNAAFLLEHSADGPFNDTYQNRILKQEAGFFLKFINRNSTEDVYQAIGDRIYIRMPRHIDLPFRDSLIKLMVDTYIQVTKKWRSLGFQEPKGLVFVWVISGIDEMRLRFDTGEQVMAFALPCRYIVIPYDVISNKMETDLEQRVFINNNDPVAFRNAIAGFLKKSFKTNLAHELTHVLVNSSIGFPDIDSFGAWFHEGMAIWISGGNEPTLTDEYKEYKRRFDFIRMKYGNQRFIRFIQDSITHKSVNESLWNNLHISDDQHFREASQSWFAEIDRVEVLLAICTVLLLGWAVYRWVQTKLSYLLYLDYLLLLVLYYWRYGFLNLRTGSVTGSMILNGASVVLMLVIGWINARHFYFAAILAREISKAQAKMEFAFQARADLFLPVEFDEAQRMIDQAKLLKLQWKNRAGIDIAKKAAGAGADLIKAAAMERQKRHARRLYAKAKRMVTKLQIKRFEAVSSQDYSSQSFDINGFDEKLGQIIAGIKSGDFLAANALSKEIIKAVKKEVRIGRVPRNE
jgi:hypothetical protein